jgi:type 2 lantibiotic biosynthesis protein LanM
MTRHTESTSDHDQWRALTLAERLTAVGKGNTLDQTEELRRRLDRWRGIPPFADPTSVELHLSSLGASEEQFLAALGAEGTELASAVQWGETLWDVTDKDQDLAPNGGRFSGPEMILEPLLSVARKRLCARLRKLEAGRPNPPFDPGSVDSMMDGHLRNRLMNMLSRTLVLELHLARLDGQLDGATPEDRFRKYLESLGQPGALRRMLSDYPVLRRRLAGCLEQWVEATAELLEHLTADIDVLRSTLLPDGEPGRLQSVSGDLADYHSNGRSVRILIFSSGARVVYKPHSLAIGQQWSRLLEWLNANGFSPDFRLLRYVDRGNYGWMEYVESFPCRSAEEVQSFYERQGGYLALLYLLGATDFHYENVIAAGAQPLLVDLESLLGVSIPPPKSIQGSDRAEEMLSQSVLRTGLLPLPWGPTSEDGQDLSGIGATEGQPSPYSAPEWTNAGTDSVHFERKPAAIFRAQNRPTLNGEPVDLLSQTNAVLGGFRRAYLVLMRQRESLLAPGGPIHALAGVEVRVILRDTRTYAVLLEDSVHPDLLRDALNCDWLFSRLWFSVADQPAFAHVIAAEHKALWRGDVPRFVTRVGSRDIWTCSGDWIPEFLTESSLDTVRRQISNLTTHDLEQQSWLIRASLVTMTSGLGISRAHRPLPLVANDGEDNLGFAIEAAVAIGDRLEALAVQDDQDGVAWMGLRLAGSIRWSVAPLGPELYDGNAGVALFLAYLAEVTGRDCYAALSRAALVTFRRQLKDVPAMQCIGAFDGAGGIIYVLSHLAALWRRPDLVAAANEVAAAVHSKVENDKNFDIIGGAAGAIGSLASLAAVDPTGPALDIARCCGDHLIASATPMTRGVAWLNSHLGSRPLAGFSHGAAGISWALALLTDLTGDERYRNCARMGVEYERGLFDPLRRNWPDLREGTGRSAPNRRSALFQTAWCHGAPGVALSRLRYLRNGFDDAATLSEIEAAIATTIQEGFGDNHSLCHGDLGNLDVLVHAETRLHNPSVRSARRRATALLLDSLRRDGWLCGIPLDVESTGLMTGIAGIGYGLLRLAAPHQVPSILALAPPANEPLKFPCNPATGE